MPDNFKIRVWFGAAFAVLFGIGIAALVRTYEWEGSVAWVSHSFEITARLEELAQGIQTTDASARQLANDFRPDSVIQLASSLRRNRILLADAERLSQDDPAQMAELRALRSGLEKQFGLLPPTGNSSAEAVAAALAAYDLAGAPAAIASSMQRLQREEERLLNRRIERQKEITATTRHLFELATILAFSLTLIAAVTTSGNKEKPSGTGLEETYRQIVELASDIVYRTDSQGRFTYCNQSALNLLHWTDREVIGRSYLKLVAPWKRRDVERFYMRQFARKRATTYLEFPVIDGHGRERWLGQNVQLITGANGVEGYQAIAREITERRRAEDDLTRSRALVEGIATTAPGVLYVYEPDTRRILFSNNEVANILGISKDELAQRILADQHFHPEDLSALRAHFEMLRYSKDGEVHRIEYRARHRKGHWVWLAARDTAFERGLDGRVRRIVGIAQDITERRSHQEQLARQANVDALTGLPGRSHFWKLAERSLRRTNLEHGRSTLCVVDLDRFREINEGFGRTAGDRVLEAVGGILRSELRQADIAGRLGGNEFGFLLPDTDAAIATQIADRILERIRSQAFGVSATGAPFSITATFGVAESSPDMTAGQLLEAADRALAEAKAAGRNRICVAA